jgi:hypothetical protein
MRAPRAARAFLALLCGYCFFLGATAAFLPHTFFTEFPFLAHWVERLPPYNEHLVTDVGGLYLGFAALFAWAARKLERPLVVPLCLAFGGVVLLHLTYHADHLQGFGTVDGAAEIAALASLLVPPLVVVWAAREERRPDLSS